MGQFVQRGADDIVVGNVGVEGDAAVVGGVVEGIEQAEQFELRVVDDDVGGLAARQDCGESGSGTGDEVGADVVEIDGVRPTGFAEAALRVPSVVNHDIDDEVVVQRLGKLQRRRLYA